MRFREDREVMTIALGGLFSSRINMNRREAHGYTSGASSGFSFRRAAGPFMGGRPGGCKRPGVHS